ncbi:MAG TPA: HAMP domain-containing histidine kinase [Epsilonproteobacteria bacterium]|nr:HAMP domain-containing histidine kinase [Campylobacterota bacterium]
MDSVKKRTLLATLGYFSTVAILLSFIYWFLKNEGFSESNYLVASLLVLFLAAGWGYIIASHLLAPKVLQDANLSQLSSEILHELNIPLSTIKANTALLEKRLDDEKSLKRLKRIEASSVRLERLYKELVYSINKEIHPVQKEQFSLRNLLKERVEIFEAYDRNHFELLVDDILLNADKIGFEKMIDNLLMNAMKYSSKASPVKIILKGNTLLIKDKGIGMDETQLLRVYERYYQADSQKDGQGIGLALVKAYCDEEQITITIQSKKDLGTSILLDLTHITS